MPKQTFFDLPEEKRERIMTAARQVFQGVPYEKASIQAIIEAAGIPRGSFYQYFEDKDDLYLYCFISREQKIYDVIYKDNMDYAMHMILDNPKENYRRTQWYAEAMEKLQDVLCADELDFDESSLHPPLNLSRALDAETARMQHKLFQEHLRNAYPNADDDKIELFSFVMSMSNLLLHEYMRLKDVSEFEATRQIRKIGRILWDNLLK